MSCFGWYKFNFFKDTTLIDDDLTRKILRLGNTMQTVTKSNFVSIIRLSKKLLAKMGQKEDRLANYLLSLMVKITV